MITKRMYLLQSGIQLLRPVRMKKHQFISRQKQTHNKKGFVFFKSRLYCWTVLQFFTWMNHCFSCHKAFNKKFLSTNAWREITVFLIYNFKSLLIIYIIFLNILMSIHTWSIKELRNLFMALYALVLCSKVFADESKNLAGPRLWKKNMTTISVEKNYLF